MVFVQTQVWAQPSNDECLGAIQLTDLDNWCSNIGEFSNVNATLSPTVNPPCFPAIGSENDVWFSFTAIATDVSITVIGNTPSNAGGSLQEPQFAIYSGNCAALTEVECASDNVGANIVESLAGPLIVGQTYYLRIDARNNNEGTFQLCINNFNAIPDPSSDCNPGVILCDKSSFTVESVIGAGNNTNEVDNSTCIQAEISSAWYKWTCDQTGSLTFTLTPNNPSDDLDFAVYRLPGGIDDCNGKELLRCMASGENVGQPFPNWEPCTGPTGLSASSTDIEEFPGCDNDDDNFVAAINMISGESFALVVNNFSNTGSGFSVDWGGSGTFLGPEAAFQVDPPLDNQCDIDVVTFINESILPPGITGIYNWTFGEGANPPNATGPGPHDVTYTSFGDKSIVLQVETDEGCIVTYVEEIFIERCCDPATNLGINLENLIDPICFMEESGLVEVSGSNGTPAYEFSVDGEFFQPLGLFINLGAGPYTLYVQDTKGCIDSLDVILTDPPPIFVEAGEDQTINLGFSTDLNAQIIPPSLDPAINWVPAESLSCDDCLDPTAMPPVSTTYYIQITDDVGCVAIDSVTINVLPVRPIYVPNAFTPDFDGINDYFTAYGGPAALQIKTLRVFDRWGGLCFEGNNIPLGSDVEGWDGTVAGKPMDTGVYVYMIEVEFIDGITGLYKGDVTLIR